MLITMLRIMATFIMIKFILTDNFIYLLVVYSIMNLVHSAI